MSTVYTGTPPTRKKARAVEAEKKVRDALSQLRDLQPGMYIEFDGAAASLAKKMREDKRFAKFDVSHSMKEKKLYIWYKPE